MYVAFGLYIFTEPVKKIQLHCLNGLNFALIFCLNFALKTISLEHFDQFFVLISTLQEKMLRPVESLYDPPSKIRKFVMQ